MTGSGAISGGRLMLGRTDDMIRLAAEEYALTIGRFDDASVRRFFCPYPNHDAAYLQAERNKDSARNLYRAFLMEGAQNDDH